MRAALALAAGTAAALGIHRLVHSVPSLPLAVALGLLVSTLGAPAGTRALASLLLRLGVVLLGLQVAAGDVRALGWERLALIVVVVAVTYLGTQRLGRALGVSAPLAQLTAAGFAICGASAIAALRDSVDARDEEVTAAIGLVTLCGSLAIVVLPLLRHPLGLDAREFGVWTGASVHDVGQVVATASTAGTVALSAAVVVKLARVLLLAPLVAIAGRRAQVRVPLFVVAFVVAIVLRSVGAVPDRALHGIHDAQTVVLTAALFGIGATTPLGRLRQLGPRPLLLGLLAWVLVAGVAFLTTLVA